MCVYSFSQSDVRFYSQSEMLNMRSPPFYAWQRPLLLALLAAQLLAFLSLLSLCLSFHPPTRRLSAISSIAFMALAILLHSGSAVAFAILSQMANKSLLAFYSNSFLFIYFHRLNIGSSMSVSVAFTR